MSVGLFSKPRKVLPKRPLLTINGRPQREPERPGSLERRCRLFVECTKRLADDPLARNNARGTPIGDGLGMEALVAKIASLFEKERSLIRWVALRGAFTDLYINTIDPASMVLPFFPTVERVMDVGHLSEPGAAEQVIDVAPDWAPRLTQQQRNAAIQVFTAVQIRAYDYQRYSKIGVDDINRDPKCYLNDAMALDFIAWSAVALLRMGIALQQMDVPEPDALDAPGWYTDPLFAKAERYWDGTDWTHRCRSLGGEISTPLRPPDPPRPARVSLVEPTADQIIAEWHTDQPAADLARWQEGMARYNAAPLENRADMHTAAELMCMGLVHYLAGRPIIAADPRHGESELVQTIWNVLVAALLGNDQTTWGPRAARHVRLALAAARRGGFQSTELGGKGTLAKIFDDRGNQMLMAAALSPEPWSFSLSEWFHSSEGGEKPRIPA